VTDRVIFKHGWEMFPNAPVWHRGTMQDTGGVAASYSILTHREPVLFKMPNGNWVSMVLGMVGTQDYNGQRIIARISTDKCKSWGPPIDVYIHTGFNSNGSAWLNFGAAGTDSNGRTHVLFTKLVGAAGVPTSMTQWYIYTDNTSLAAGWAAEVDVTSAVNPQSYPWFIFGPSKIVQIKGGAQAGYLVCGANKRDTIGLTSYSLLVYSANGGTTWARGGRANEADSNNDNSNETDVCEIGSSGRVYMNSRRNGLTGRRQAIVTDVTADPITMTFQTENGSQQVDSWNTAGSVCSAPNGDLFFSAPSSNSTRNRLQAYLSTDAKLPATTNPTFPVFRPICYRLGGYSSIGYLGGGNLAVHHENTVDTEREAGGVGVGTQYIHCTRFSKKWLRRTFVKTPDVVEYQFNDYPSETTALFAQIGAGLADHGTHNNRAQGNGATNVMWDTVGEQAVIFSNSPGLVLQKDQADGGERWGGIWDTLNLSFTIILRLRVDTLDGFDRVVLDNRGGVTTAAGMTLTVRTATQKLEFAWNDGTTGNQTITNDIAIEGSNRYHTVYIIRDRVAGKVRMAIDGDLATGSQDDGVFLEPTPVTDNNGSLLSAIGCKLGSLTSGATPLDGRISYLKLIRGRADTSFVSAGSVVKVEPLVLAGNRITDPTKPASWANVKLALATTWRGGVGGVDFHAGTQFGPMPPRAGQGIGSWRCTCDATAIFRTPSESTALLWEYDQNCGWLARLRTVAPAGTYLRRVNPANGNALYSANYDFIQKTMIFSISMVLKKLYNGAAAALVSTRGNASAAGILYLIGSDNQPFAWVTNTAGTTLILGDAAGWGPTILAGETWYLGISCAGTGSPISVYHGKYTAGLTPPSSLTQNFMGVATTTTDSGSLPLCLGIGSDETTSYVGDIAVKNVLLFNTDIGSAGHRAWADFAVQGEA
jgi:hypothetical protein